jgi:hypothetical protein
MPINFTNNITNKASGSIASFFGANNVLSQTVGSALQSGITLVQQFNQMDINISTLTYKAQQIFLWNLSGKSYDNLAVEKSFIPGNFAKVNAVTNPTPKRNPISENKIQLNLTRNALYSGGGDISSLDKDVSDDFTGNSPDKMFVYIKFKDSSDKWWMLKLRATIGDNKLTDTFRNNWNGYSAFGRTQKNYVYSETERSIPLVLHEYAYSQKELDFFYQKIDTLAKLNWGRSDVANSTNFSLKYGNVIYISIGKLFTNLPAIINQMEFQFDENNWDMQNFVPTRVQITMSLTIVHYENKNFDSRFYDYNNNSNVGNVNFNSKNDLNIANTKKQISNQTLPNYISSNNP